MYDTGIWIAVKTQLDVWKKEEEQVKKSEEDEVRKMEEDMVLEMVKKDHLEWVDTRKGVNTVKELKKRQKEAEDHMRSVEDPVMEAYHKGRADAFKEALKAFGEEMS